MSNCFKNPASSGACVLAAALAHSCCEGAVAISLSM